MAVTLPRTDDGLLSWSLHFGTGITEDPEAVGLTTAQAAAYMVVQEAYAAALAACDPAVRSKSTTASKNAARSLLRTASTQTASIIDGTPSVTDAQKIALGMTVRATPTPIPTPANPPAMEVVSAVGWLVTVKLHDSAIAGRRGKPPGVAGASIFSFVGAEAPADISQWVFQGNTGRSPMQVAFDSSLAPGTKVWLTAFWFNPRKESGPACPPISTNLPGGSVSMAA
jgi:hypothetical protein